MKKKIWVVSQERSIRNLLKNDLGDEGYEVFLVDTGQEAIGRMKRHRPDLVLIDTVLSDIDGEEIVNRFEEAAALPPTLVWWANHSGSDLWSLGVHIIKTRNFFKIKSMIMTLCPSGERESSRDDRLEFNPFGSTPGQGISVGSVRSLNKS